MTANPERGDRPQFTIHDRLRKAREWAELEQSELAERIEVDRGSISNYETGKTQRLKSPVIKRWALACEVDLDWIRTGETTPDTPDGLEISPSGCNGGRVLAFRARDMAPSRRAA